MRIVLRKKRQTFLDTHVVQNPDDEIRTWTTSPKASPVSAAKADVEAYMPESVVEASDLLRSRHALGIVFSKDRYASPFPFGWVWLNLADGKQSWARRHFEYQLGQKGAGYDGYLGNTLYQDGCKFSSSIWMTSNNHEPKVVILSRQWVRELGRNLKALVDWTNDDYAG